MSYTIIYYDVLERYGVFKICCWKWKCSFLLNSTYKIDKGRRVHLLICQEESLWYSHCTSQWVAAMCAQSVATCTPRIATHAPHHQIPTHVRILVDDNIMWAAPCDTTFAPKTFSVSGVVLLLLRSKISFLFRRRREYGAQAHHIWTSPP